jgi:hypothetical protein
MSYKAYTVLVSKTAVPHPGALQQKAADLAKNAGMSASQQWFAWRGNDWVIGFANNYGPAFQFTTALETAFLSARNGEHSLLWWWSCGLYDRAARPISSAGTR